MNRAALAPEYKHQVDVFLRQIKRRSDRLMNYFLASYFVVGLLLAHYYDTYDIAVTVGGLSLVAYYSAKALLPSSNLYQYVLSAMLGIFMAQYIYQMHGLFEMHFIAFIGSAVLITYQNWKLQIPLALVVIIHHAIFGYLQYTGYDKIYFTQLDYMSLQTFLIHGLLATTLFFICGLWAHHFRKYSERHLQQTFEMGRLQEEKLQQEALARTNEELRKSNDELDRFVYSVSHDLRAPLSSMSGIVDLTELTSEDPLVLQNTAMLRQSINRLDGFIKDILDYSRNARTNVAKEEIDFQDLSGKIVDDLRFMAVKNQSNVEITCAVSTDHIFLGDKTRLHIILNNLISNGIRYHDTAKNQPFVRVEINVRDTYAEIWVKDNGIGIADEKQAKVFEMFYRVSKQSAGSGLGLYIVKETVDKLNGSIEMNSAPDMGTEFKITVPNSIL